MNNKNKVYMIMPDVTDSFDLAKFHLYIQELYNDRYINAWWHYLHGGLYFIDSMYNVNQLYNLFVKHMPSRQFIVMEVDPKNQQGWLIKESWDWFKPYRN